MTGDVVVPDAVGGGPDAPVRLLVVQWAHPGRADELARIEDVLVDLARSHGAVVTCDRSVPFRTITHEPQPDEIHQLTFPDEAAVDAYVADPERGPWAEKLYDVLAHSLIIRLSAMDR